MGPHSFSCWGFTGSSSQVSSLEPVMPFQLCFLQTAEHRVTVTECRGAPLVSSASLQIESFLLIYSAKVSVLGNVSPQHKAPSFPDNRFPHCGPAALQCAENDACLGKKTAIPRPREIGMIWGLESGAQLANMCHSSPSFLAACFCQNRSLTRKC